MSLGESSESCNNSKSSGESKSDSNPLKIAFFGTPLFAKTILETLWRESIKRESQKQKSFEIVALITQEDKPFGRKKELKMPETKAFVLSQNLQIPIFQPQKVSEILGDLRTLKPDIALVVAYGKMLPQAITDEFFCINIHGSILPKYRGASPINAMILNDEKFLGVSAIKMNERLDSGDILGFSAMKNEGFGFEKLSATLSAMGANLALKVINRLNQIAPLRQNDCDSSHCHKLAKSDGIVRFIDAKEIFLKSLAFEIYPQIALENGLKLFGVEINETELSHNAGEILEVCESAVVVGCESGSIIVESLQSAGKNKMSAVAYLNGARLKVGNILR